MGEIEDCKLIEQLINSMNQWLVASLLIECGVLWKETSSACFGNSLCVTSVTFVTFVSDFSTFVCLVYAVFPTILGVSFTSVV